LPELIERARVGHVADQRSVSSRNQLTRSIGRARYYGNLIAALLPEARDARAEISAADDEVHVM
jgi:hypothetical protein